MPFGTRLRAIRKGEIVREGPEIKLRELARASGISITTLSEAENLKGWLGKLPSLEDLEVLAECLDVSLPDLIGRPIRGVPDTAAPSRPVAPNRRSHPALRDIFTGLAARGTLMQEVEMVRREQPPEVYQEFADHLVRALEANVVLALRVLGLRITGKTRQKKRAV